MKSWITAAALCSALAGAAFAQSKHCDRACMVALTDQYLAALVKHDPSSLPLSKGVRFTENTQKFVSATGCGWARRKLPRRSRFMLSIQLRIKPVSMA